MQIMRKQKKCFKNFEIKNLGECHNLHVQSNKLLLADVFENFRKMWLEIYKLDPAKFLSASWLAWKTVLEKTKVKLEVSVFSIRTKLSY